MHRNTRDLLRAFIAREDRFLLVGARDAGLESGHRSSIAAIGAVLGLFGAVLGLFGAG